MKRMASDALISAEKTAVRPMAPTSGGTVWTSSIGSAESDEASDGNCVRAIMPSSAGTIANTRRPTAFRPTPTRTARSSRAPKIFCSSPGDTMKGGTMIARVDEPW